MKRKVFLGVIALFIIFGIHKFTVSEAAEKYVSSVAWDVPQKAGGATFVAKRQKVGSEYFSKIIMKKNGKSKILVSKVDAAFVTNGSILYYSKNTKKINDYTWNMTIYSYHIQSGKSVKVVSGRNYMVAGCSGKYLYCGCNNEADGIELYAVHLKTKKKKYMADVVGSVTVFDGKVLTTTNSGAAGNDPMYLFREDGSGKKKLADGNLASVKNGKIYYYKYNVETWKIKVYSCSYNGKNKKVLTGWLDAVPAKYL